MSETDGEAENLPQDTETDDGATDYASDSSFVEEESEENLKNLFDSEKFLSGPWLSEESTLNLNLLEFDYSFGYNCRKYFNLCVLDEETVAFSSGNFINFLNVPSKIITFRRSALGGGIGHIRKNENPQFPYFAVAECGNIPIIILYVWPSMEIISVLKGGAEKVYTNLDFNPDGDLLVSQSGEPDYLITVWDWQNHTILLRTKSYVNDVYRVKFSPYVTGQLTTCGIAHIKFWKMASTFTGLKLKGELGRFGKTEYSDIIGVLPMPDAKVVSGCSWGNILVWDDGLITFEVFRSLRKKCHDAPIVQFYYLDGELWTVSMDGHVKVWWFEKIDQAEPPDDDRVILVDPTYDFYTPGVKLMAIEKRRLGDSSDTFWYAQDGNGGIWLIDLNTEEDPKPSERLYTCHGGKIVGLASCPYGPYIATLGELGTFYLYNYILKTRVLDYTFPAAGICLIWLPHEIDPTGEILLAGFGDGQVRVCCLHIPEDVNNGHHIKLSITQVIKPHNKPLTTMSINPQGRVLVTAAEDSTIFVFKIDFSSHSKLLIPIGFFESTDIVTCITWHSSMENTVLLGCLHGQMMQIPLPVEEENYTATSYQLNLEPKYNSFTTYKSQIKRDIKIQEIEERKAKKVAKKRKEMEQIQKENPGLEIDEETFLADSESEEDLEPLFIPEVPNRIIWLKYTADETIWLSMAGYDAGYIYEYRIDQQDPIPYRFKLLDGAEDKEISCYVYTHNQEYIVFAMEDGSIRVNKINPDDYTDLSDYYAISMHFNQKGFVPTMCFSYDEKYFFSCGHDGNIFSYKFNPKNYEFPWKRSRYFRDDHSCISIQDGDGHQKLSLEEVKIKTEDDRILKLANEHKNKIRDILKIFKEQYKKLLIRNSKLMHSQVIPKDQLVPDRRVAEYVDQIFSDKINIIKRKLAFDVEKSKIQLSKLQDYFTNPCDRHPVLVKGINKPDCAIMGVRQRKMPQIFYEMFDVIEQKLKDEEGKGRPPERTQVLQKSTVARIAKSSSPLEFFLLSLTPNDIAYRLGPKLTRLLDKYRARRQKWEKRAEDWEHFLARKPIPGKNHPDDEKFLAEAKLTFGNCKLKEDPDYKVPLEERKTTVKHYKKLLETRGKQYNLRHKFIQTVFDIRDYKYELIDKLKEKQQKIDAINEELPEGFRKNGPPIPEYDDSEFPEEKLQVQVLPAEIEADLDDPDMPRQPIFVEKAIGDALEKQLVSSKVYPKLVDGFFWSTINNNEILQVADMSFEQLLNYPEHLETPFESCLKAVRLNRLLFYQKLIPSEMLDMINDFNNWIYQAKKKRLPLLIKGNFIDTFIVCLNEELQILKNCEEQEDKLSQTVNVKLKTVHDMEDHIDSLKAKKENIAVKLENLKLEEGKIQEKFRVAVEGNKFYEFLKKVFRKKYKPPQVKTADESSSSSSSSSEESDYEDAGSIDSKDFGFIKQDLNVCPKGCESALFNFIVELRSKRHQLEQNEREGIRDQEVTKKEIDMAMRKSDILKRSYNESQEQLEIFTREKQKKLNKVSCTVVLNFDQIYGRIRQKDMDISDFLVFSRSKLSGLYKQVKLLHEDALVEQDKHDTYLKHLIRMRKDIIYMQRKAHSLKRDIRRLLRIKFGQEVDINELEMAVLQRSFQKNIVNELEEVLLKKLVYELRLKMTDVRGIYIAALERWQKKIVKSQHELAREIKENTRRLELLAVISREKKNIARFIDTQDKRRKRVEHIEMIHEDFTKDLQKLQEITNEQARTIQELKEEIKMLKSKGMVQEIRKRKEKMDEYKEIHPEIKELEKGSIDYEKYIEEFEDEFEEEIEKSKTDITMPLVSSESEDLVRTLIENLMKTVDKDLVRKSNEALVQSILSGIIKCISVNEIIMEIINNIPIEEFTEEQRTSIESVATLLMSIEEPKVEEDSITCIKAILEETLSEVLCYDPHYLIPTVLEQLLDSLPIELVSSKNALDEIAYFIKSSITDLQLDKHELNKSLERLPSEDKREILDIVQNILERVYGEGIDYLYIINK
ncbi:hypothetical protein ABEB36_005142 [Hypothenemus hampei]|uniref:Cilia- and flagella-associated protein 44 n=1 Tax=Hypothenemus hampei TaxID=57062 RepID=A0ABD1EXK3_HYPHA